MGSTKGQRTQLNLSRRLEMNPASKEERPVLKCDLGVVSVAIDAPDRLLHGDGRRWLLNDRKFEQNVANAKVNGKDTFDKVLQQKVHFKRETGKNFVLR